MKKLKLKLDGKEMLSKQQMKKITGGYYSCYVYSTHNSGCHGNLIVTCTGGQTEQECHNYIYNNCQHNHYCCDHIQC